MICCREGRLLYIFRSLRGLPSQRFGDQPLDKLPSRQNFIPRISFIQTKIGFMDRKFCYFLTS